MNSNKTRVMYGFGQVRCGVLSLLYPYSTLLGMLVKVRGRAVIRRELPFLPILFWLVVGQSLALFGELSWCLLLAVLFWFLSLRLRGTPKHGVALLSVSIGLAQALTCYLVAEERGASLVRNGCEHFHFVARAAPSGDRRGRVSFRAVAGCLVIEKEGGFRSLHHSPSSTVVEVVTKDVPWSPVVGITNGSTGALWGDLRLYQSTDSFGRHKLRRGISGKLVVRSLHVESPPRSESTLLNRAVTDLKWQWSEGDALLMALLTGRRAYLPSGAVELLRGWGLSHLFVVSGYHLGVLYLFLYFSVVSIARLSRRVMTQVPTLVCAKVTALIGVGYYAYLLGGGVSVIRAVLMASCVTIASLLYSSVSLLHSLLFSGVVIASVWPGSFEEPGVQLGFCAVATIALVGQSRFESRARQAIKMALALWVVTQTLCLWWFGSVSWLALGSSLVASPIFALVLKISFAAVLLTPFSASISQWLLSFASASLEYLLKGLKALDTYLLIFSAPQALEYLFLAAGWLWLSSILTDRLLKFFMRHRLYSRSSLS